MEQRLLDKLTGIASNLEEDEKDLALESGAAEPWRKGAEARIFYRQHRPVSH